jgi:membrane fusion protein, heavy metal efflux system
MLTIRAVRGWSRVSGPALAAVALIVLTSACNDSPTPAPAATAPGTAASPEAATLAPKLVSPEIVTRESVIETTGKVQFNDEGLVRVHAPVTGRVVEVFASPGDPVETGGRLFTIDSADLGAAKADYAKAVADVERSQDSLRLARELFDVRAVAQKEVRATENDARKAMAESERAAARLQTLGVGSDRLPEVAARTDLSTTLLVRAPRGGIVVERNVVAGQVVAYGQADAPVNLFVIADLSTMWVVADVYEPDLPRLRRGQPMVVTPRCCPGQHYDGTVSYISDAVDRETRTVKVRAVVPNAARTLKAEMFVTARLMTGAVRALTLPQEAIHREGGLAFVLVATGSDTQERRTVRLGAEMGDRVEVLDGVTAADRVVGSGSIMLKGRTR